MSKVVSVVSGIILSSIVAYILPLYIAWVPDFDIWVFLLLVGINLTQCLPNPNTP